jgi:hypothetical protein
MTWRTLVRRGVLVAGLVALVRSAALAAADFAAVT